MKQSCTRCGQPLQALDLTLVAPAALQRYWIVARAGAPRRHWVSCPRLDDARAGWPLGHVPRPELLW